MADVNGDSLRGKDLAEYIVTTYGFSVYPMQPDWTPLQNCETCRSRSVRYSSGSLSCTACVQGFGKAPETVKHFVSAETMWCHGSHSATARPDRVKDFWPTDAPPAVALAPSALRVVRVSPQMEERDLSEIIDYAGMERTLVLGHPDGTRSMIYMGYGPATTSGPTTSYLQLMHTCSAFLWDGRIVADYPVSHMQKSIYGSLQECDSLLGPCSCSVDYDDSNPYRYNWQHCPQSPDTHPGITNCRGGAQVTDDVPRFELEADLVNWLVRQLSPFFEIQRQVSGKSVHGKSVRLDLLLTPRDTTGWKRTDVVFGLEVKQPSSDPAKLIAQAIDYSNSTWTGHGRIPILMYPLASKFRNEPSFMHFLRTLAAEFMVGELSRDNALGWTITMGGAPVWHASRGPAGVGRTSLFRVRDGHR